jgi:hypothetical protein
MAFFDAGTPGHPPGTVTIMDADSDTVLMTAQAAPRVPKDHPSKKAAGKKGSRGTTALNAVAQYSLTGFLDEEPDIYSVSDIKVRYRFCVYGPDCNETPPGSCYP